MSALREFATKALETNRIGFADLRRLQRDMLPQRIATTDEAEMLLAIDGALARADRDWTDYLTAPSGSSRFGGWIRRGASPRARLTGSQPRWLQLARNPQRRS
jgi:hypothetical protein